jgi:VWFA-related protein
MKPQSILALALALVLLLPAPGPGQGDQDFTVRISVNLIQFDVVVTDGKGNHVKGLEAADFEVLQDNQPRKITHFSYVEGAPPQGPAPKYYSAPVRRAAGNAPPPPPMKAKPSDVKRTIAFVVDDLGLSFESIAYVRSSLKKFVDQQMQPGDMVAIIRTGAGMGALQQFTMDKDLLYASIARVKWNPLGRVGVSSFRSFGTEDSAPLAESEFGQRTLTAGTLGAMEYIVDGLKDYQGRKALILYTESMRMHHRGGSYGVSEPLQTLADDCARAQVVIYPVDPRGLQVLNLGAADKVSTRRPDRMMSSLNRRRDQNFDSKEGMHYLAEQTGGVFTQNTNNLNLGVNNALADQSGYYLIGWNPGSNAFNRAKSGDLYHHVKIVVKRPGLKVRTRAGYSTAPEKTGRPAYGTRSDQLSSAINSPFTASDVHLHLTALFGNEGERGSHVTSYLHVQAKDLTFTDDEDGFKQIKVDVLLTTYGDNGGELDSTNQTQTISVKGKTYERFLREGFVYKLDHPVRIPGFYQLRAAVRDANSGKVGSATQFIEVPDVKKGKLALSGIILKERSVDTEGGQSAEQDPQGTPFLRIFKPGEVLTYGYEIINAKAESSVETQVKLFRDGKEVYKGNPMPVTGEQNNAQHLLTGGVLKLASGMEPGDYQLQVIATDRRGAPNSNTVAQWIDFEVTKN